MKPHCKHSLRNRVGKIIAIFSIIIIMFYTGVMAFLLEWGLSHGAGGIIWQETRLFMEDYKKHNIIELPKGRSVNGYIGSHTLPDPLLEMFQENLTRIRDIQTKDRWYVLKEFDDSYVHHNVMVSYIADMDEYLFIHYKLVIPKNLEFDVWDSMYYTAIAGGILVIFMLLVFRQVLQSSLSPLVELSKWIDRIEENQAPEELPKVPDNEIGQVALSLFHALERINHANEKEKHFLRNASHELRTPISIIRNTMDVIEYKKETGQENIDHLLERIRKASDTMKAVTEAILWLAIENYSPPSQSKVDLREIVEDLTTDNQNLLKDRKIELELQLDGLEPVQAEKSLIYIVCDNLIRNAFQHASEQCITIKAKGPHSIEVINARQDVEGVDEQKTMQTLNIGSFGLGLALVNKISDKMSWNFTFKIEDNLATARLDL